jgi:RPE-spondin, putative
VFEVQKARKVCESIEGLSGQLIPGRQVCVACQQAAMRKHLGYRCIGHGVQNESTRWTMLSVPNCNGRWIRRRQYTPCQFAASSRLDFIFV